MTQPAAGNVRANIRLTFLNTMAAGAIQFFLITTLTRILSPAAYGGYALCLAIASLSAVFVTNVMERVLVIETRDGNERDETAAIAVLCIVASALALSICLVLRVFSIGGADLRVLSILLVGLSINAATIVPRVRLRRQIRFGPIVFAETSGLIVGAGLTTIALALAGWGAFALVIGVCVQNLWIAVVLRLRHRGPALSPPTPANCFRLVRSATALGGNAATEILNGQVSPLVLGTRLGPIALGLFNRSYGLVQMPIQLLVSSMSRVMISALFAVSGDVHRLRAASRSLVRVAAVIVTPVAAGIAGAGGNFVLVAFGAAWAGAAPLLPLLAVSAWAVMMGTLYAIMAEALHAFAAKTRAQLVSTALLALLAWAGTWLGLVGAMGGIAIGGCIFLLMFARLAARLLELPLRTALAWLVPGIVVGLPCFAASLTIGYLLSGPTAVVFAIQVFACASIDMVGLILLYPGLALQLVEGMLPAALRLVPSLTTRLRQAAARHPSR